MGTLREKFQPKKQRISVAGAQGVALTSNQSAVTLALLIRLSEVQVTEYCVQAAIPVQRFMNRHEVCR